MAVAVERRQRAPEIILAPGQTFLPLPMAGPRQRRQEQWKRNPHRLAHADRLAGAVNLDMAAHLVANTGANCSPDKPA
jgi:hypothetical protein